MYVPPHISGRNYLEYKDVKKTLEEKELPIGGYVRISTQKEAQKTSIENQKKLLEQWAELKGHQLVRVYIDVKTGEYTYLRSEIKQMFKDARAGKIKGIVSKEIARTSRDVMDIITIKRTLFDYGAFFISIKENYDSRTDDDEFLLILHGGLAQKERKTTSSRVKVTQLMKAKEGKTNVPLPAFGYMLSEDRQRLVVNPETAPIYKKIVEKFLSGWGQLKIAKWLNEQQIPTRRGRKWSTNSIRTILSNPVYLGITIYNATTLVRDSKGRQKRVIRPKEEWIVKENTHESLLTEEEFNKIQEIILQRREKFRHEWSCDKKYLGSSILRCAACGGKIYGTALRRKGKNTGKVYYKYRCLGINGKCNGKTRYWDMEKINNTLLFYIASIFRDRGKLLKFIKRNIDLITGDLNHLLIERDALKARLDQVKEAVRKQQLAFEQDVITLEEYRSRIRELREEREMLNTKLGNINFRLEKVDSVDERINNVFKKVNSYIDNIRDITLEEKFQLIHHFSHIYINERGNIVDVKFRL
jgi:DNA invertase Pin-like site-specific DNA recombinase